MSVCVWVGGKGGREWRLGKVLNVVFGKEPNQYIYFLIFKVQDDHRFYVVKREAYVGISAF